MEESLLPALPDLKVELKYGAEGPTE